MFTGLIEEVGIVRRLERGPAGGSLSMRASTVLNGTKVGDSIAVSGACLTVIALDGQGFVVECMPETLARTTLGEAGPGSLLNLERSLRWGDRLGGHLVLGHVDDVGEVLRVRREGIAWEVRISLPAVLRGTVAAKGSIAVDGISLTVMRVDMEGFEVGLIPHTLKETTLRAAHVGMRVNLEADVLARYVMQSLQAVTGAARGGALAGTAAVAEGAARGLTEGFYANKGSLERTRDDERAARIRFDRGGHRRHEERQDGRRGRR